MASRAATRVCLILTGAGRGFCAGQDLGDRAVAPGGAAVDLGESIEKNYKPLVMTLRNLPMPVIAAVNGVAAGAGANIALGMRHGDRSEVCELRAGVSEIGVGAGFGRDVVLAAAHWECARHGARVSRGQVDRGAGGAVGPHLALCRGRGVGTRWMRWRGSWPRPRRGAWRARSRRSTRVGDGRWKRSSTSSAITSASWATAPITPKALPRSRKSGRHNSPAASQAMPTAAHPVDGSQTHRRAPPIMSDESQTAQDAQRLAEQWRRRCLREDTTSQLLGIRIISVRPGGARLAMTVRHDMVNGHRICHGGMIFTLADSAFASACNSHNESTVAAAASIDFLRPASRATS